MRPLTTLLALTAASAGLFAASVGPAEAVYVRPSSAPLTDSSGAGNGCTAAVTVDAGRADGTPRQPISIVVDSSLSCPAGADVHWATFSSALYEVMADGTLRTIYGPGLTGQAGSTDPIESTGATTYSACRDNAGKGKHTWLVRATIKTKHAAHDDNSYMAKVGASKLIHCS
jgi:hypothetical protein